MNGVLTGLIVIGLGGMAFLIAFVSSRATGTPFINKNMIGGYNGVVGIGIMAVGVITLVISLVSLVLAR